MLYSKPSSELLHIIILLLGPTPEVLSLEVRYSKPGPLKCG